MLAFAKITAKGQTTIPQDVRAALNVAPGDLIAWEVGADGTATVRRVQPINIEYLRASKARSASGPAPPTRRLTVSFDRYAVVRVPFPFTDRNATKNRPAVVLSDAVAFNTPAGHSVMAMITSQAPAGRCRPPAGRPRHSARRPNGPARPGASISPARPQPASAAPAPGRRGPAATAGSPGPHARPWP